MTDMIERVEAVTRGSRVLDYDIESVVSGQDFPADCPPYTTSLDAALTLVPEGWSVGNLWEAVSPKDRPWWGLELRKDAPYRCQKVLGARSAALAFCIAALKARAERGDAGGCYADIRARKSGHRILAQDRLASDGRRRPEKITCHPPGGLRNNLADMLTFVDLAPALRSQPTLGGAGVSLTP